MAAIETIRSPFAGIADVRGDYVLILGEHVQLADGALDALLALAERTPDAGDIGGCLLGIDGLIVHAGGIASNDGSLWSYGVGVGPDARHLHVREVDWASTDFLLVRTEALREAGGHGNARGAARDADLAFRLRAA